MAEHRAKGIATYGFMAANTLLACLPLFLMGVLRVLPGRRWRARMDARMDRVIDYWVSANTRLNTVLRIFEVRTSGDDLSQLSRDRWYMIISNHQTWADILVLQITFRKFAPPMKFFTKKQLLYIPFFGTAMWLLKFPFVKRLPREVIEANPQLAEHDRQATMAACEGFRDNPVAVLNFLEGTRFTPEKRTGQCSPYEHLLRPKVGGLGTVVQSLQDKLDCLVDVTIRYPGGPGGAPGFYDFLCGRAPVVDVHVRLYPLHPLTENVHTDAQFRDQLKTTVDAIWREKDRRLSAAPS